MTWSLLQITEVPPDAKALMVWLPSVVGSIIVPFVGAIKKFFPKFSERIKVFIPYEHWVAIISVIVAFVYSQMSGLDLTLVEVINSTFQIVGASNFLYAIVNKGKSPFVKMRGRKFGND